MAKNRVLWIDHGMGTYEKMVEFASQNNIELVPECSPYEGIRIATHEPFDTILITGRLEFSTLHGSDLVRKLREHGVTTRIVMFSSMEVFNTDGIIAGANAQFEKDRLKVPGWERDLLEILFPS